MTADNGLSFRRESEMSDLKPPKKIYLQMLDEDGEEQDEITWCEDEINDTDIPYVLQSALTASQEENKRYKDALEIANDRIDDYQTSFKVVLDEKCPKDEIHCGCVPILKYTLSNYRNNMVLITTFPEEPNSIITIKNIANNTLNENFYSDYSASKQVGEFWVERLNEKEYELMQIIKDLRVQLQSALNGGKND